MPLFRGAYEATAVFYFDFVRLRRIPALREFRVLFFQAAVDHAGHHPVLWALAVPWGCSSCPTFRSASCGAPAAVRRAQLIGAYQIRLFAEGQFRTLNATIVFSAGLLLLVWIDINPASDPSRSPRQ